MYQQQSLYSSLLSRKVAFGATVGGAVIFMVIGVVLWGGFNWGMEITNTMEFCTTCHEMEENVYREYQGTIHDANRSGVRAGCPDCHVPRPWVHKIIRKIKASNEIYHKLMGTVSTPEKFEAHRLEMAKRVWGAMKATDSRECRNCHDWNTMNPERQKPRARNQHLFAMEKGHTCIDCHKGIAHKKVHDQLSEEELEFLAKPDPAYVREVPTPFLLGLERAKAAESEAEKKAMQEAEQERERRRQEKEAEKKRIDEAVAKALAAQQASAKPAAGAPAAAAAPAAPAGTGGAGFGVDWNGVPERRVTLFYPGQSSMEWTLVGKFHGGARPFKAGDRCFTCHDKETANMGGKIVSGEKLEPTVIPGKRAAIPVSVQAAHDADNLYLRFQWEASPHAPVPFVEGGKMDPKNPVKLALMLATDKPEYASQTGCWGTCHHDARTMPEPPEDPKASGLPLDFSLGVTKYIKESRTEVEEAGRMGKKLGGWDKLKDEAGLQQALAEGKFYDLLRVKSDGTVEDGMVLGQRIMSGGQGFDAVIRNEGGVWTVEMRRKLKSDKAGDVTIEPGILYNFGFAIHDDFSDARFHHVSLGYKLGLDNEQAEVNAVKREASPVAAPAPAAPPATSAAPAAAAAPATAPVAGSGPNALSGPVDAGVDWSKAGERLISLLYPGQTSMEWTLVGKYHGGARPFKAGDRCFTCHDKEAGTMGNKMVSGEKAEETPIPGKRGGIPVTVQSTHDAENLYLRFQWQGTTHVPVSFVDGGKMDPKNPVKLAMMFATDKPEYAAQAGCWGTCHHDARAMPEKPADPAASGLPLDFSLGGVTKYIKESRTEVEEAGRMGKKLGGWDKLKDEAGLQQALAEGKFMDLLRVKSDGTVEDGMILAQRVMSGGQGFQAEMKEEGGGWTLTIKRRLKSDKPGDVSLEPGTLYNFGFAIHDDYTDGRFHHVSVGYKLGLDDEKAEVNVKAQ